MIQILCYYVLPLAVDMLLEVEIVGRVARLAVYTDLKMQMGSCGSACLSNEGYNLTSFYVLPFFDQVLGIV